MIQNPSAERSGYRALLPELQLAGHNCRDYILRPGHAVGNLAGVRGSKCARMPPVSVETWNPF
jgi:hypothetical protein